MTVAEMIALLGTLPPDLPVIVDGYEGGYNDVTADRVGVVLHLRDAQKGVWFEGNHSVVPLDRPIPEGAAEAVLISRCDIGGLRTR